MGTVRRLSAHFVLTPDGIRRNIIVTVDGEGKVLGLSSCERPDSLAGVEHYSGIIIPGLINAHTHLELSHMRGLIPPGGGFAAFGRAMSAVRDTVGQEERLKAISFNDAKMWSEGVSAAGDISNTDTTLGVKTSSRIHYHTFAEVYGLARQSTQRFLSLVRLNKERGLTASLSPHSMYSLNDGLLSQTVSEEEGILSVHFMESEGERELFAGKGEMAQWFRDAGFEEDFTRSYVSPADRLVKNVPAHRKVLLVHNTCVSEEDVDMVNDHFSGNVTWVVCPRSNRFITGMLPPVSMLTRKGCRIAVGTDSLASNVSLSVLEELKILDGQLGQLLEWATRGGAEALGVAGNMGTLEPGKKPGVVIVENIDPNRMELTEKSTSRRLV